MRAGLVSSAALHVGIIGFMLVSFSSARPLDAMQESMPIDIVSDAELSQMMAGKKDAPKAEKPKPVVEKVAPTPKPAEQLDAKVDDKKPEVKAANEPVAPPPPPPAEAKPEPKPPAAAQATPQPAPPKDAESLAAKPPEAPKDEPKPDQQAQAKPAPAPPRKPKDIPPKVVQQPPKDQQEFKPNEIAALLDKRTATRQASIGDTINNTAALGASVGTAATLSQTEIDALRARLMQLWNPPAGAANPEELIVTIRIRLNQDGTLSGPPMVVTSGTSPFFMTARDSAIRAIFRGQPFNMLNPAKYEAWKDIEVTFDPREMVRG